MSDIHEPSELRHVVPIDADDPTFQDNGEGTYEVSVRNTFDAGSPEDAVRQFVAWIVDNAYSAGYRVTNVTTPGPHDPSVFIDADDIDFSIQHD